MIMEALETFLVKDLTGTPVDKRWVGKHRKHQNKENRWTLGYKQLELARTKCLAGWMTRNGHREADEPMKRAAFATQHNRVQEA